MENPRHLLRQFIWKHKWSYLLSVLSIILSEFITVQFPNILGQFTDTLKSGHLTQAKLLYYAAALAAVGLGYVVFFGYGQFRNGQLGRKFEYQLRRRLFLQWETLSTSYFRRKSIGDLLNHAMSDVQTVREALSGGMNMTTNAVFLMAAILYMMFRTINVTLTLISMIPMLFVPIFIIWLGPQIRHASKEVQEALSDMADTTEESFSAIRLIKATANEKIEEGRFTVRVDAIVARQMSMFRRSALFQSTIPLMGSISFVIALAYGGYLVIHGTILLGAFVAFTLYLTMLINPLQQIGFVVNTVQRASASLTRLEVLLGEQPEIEDRESALSIEGIGGDIEFNLDAFQYPDGEHPVLQNITIQVKRGQTLGIVGRTASGKTTLVNLLPRVFEAPPKSVFIDGYDIRDLRLEDLRIAIAYVPQDGFLFSTTIAENIAFSTENATREEVEQAAKDACIYDNISEFKDGFDTMIGERGVTLSGGQKQRTSIARAFLKDAPILILDDSLSAVDMNTEKQILARLQAMRKDKTTIIIAHRLSAVRHADIIIVLEEGQMVEQGTHDMLLASGGIYASMYAMQEEPTTEEVMA